MEAYTAYVALLSSDFIRTVLRRPPTAEKLASAAVAECPHDDPTLANQLSNLATVLRLQFTASGDESLLDRCLALDEKCYQVDGVTTAELTVLQVNHATVLKLRFARSGNRRDLDEALRLVRAAQPAANRS